MSQIIISRTISSATDKRLALANGQIMRKFNFLNTWNVLRIGIQFGFNGAASIAGTPQLVFGLNSGTVNGYADVTTQHFLGIRTLAASMTYNAGPPAYYSTSTAFKLTKRIGTTTTDGGAFGSPYFSAAMTTARSALVLQITRGSPNFTVEPVFPNNAPGAQADINDSAFLNMMEALTMTDAAAIQSGYAVSTPQTIAIDTGTNGDFDSILVYWDRSAAPLEISSIRHRKIS